MAQQCALTPVKIRGKRRGIPAEKWNRGKRRSPELGIRERQPSQQASEAASGTSHPSKRRKEEPLSPLEMLPAEILQDIFEYSGNIELPTVARHLASKLSKSQHLYAELTTRLLRPVLGFQQGSAAAVDLKAAQRLMNSRFFSWTFFTSWLRSMSKSFPLTDDADWQACWSALMPSGGLLPPRKLLHPPFTREKVRFLSVLSRDIEDIAETDAAFAETANEGLHAAVQESNVDATELFLGMGLKSNTELLRIAVESGCDKKLVHLLLSSRGTGGSDADKAIDLLDPVLWRWAETARAQGNDRGAWLMALLRDAQRRRNQ